MKAILNPIGFKIKKVQIDTILTSSKTDSTRRHVEFFFKGYPLSKKLLTRYVAACNAMSNISVAPADKDIYQKLIEPISSAKRILLIYSSFKNITFI